MNSYKEISRALSAHQSWVEHVAELAVSWPQNADELRGLGNPTSCDFGKWLVNKGKSIIKDPLAYSKIDNVHSIFHDRAECLQVEIRASGNSDLVQRLLNEMRQQSSKLISFVLIEKNRHQM